MIAFRLYRHDPVRCFLVILFLFSYVVVAFWNNYVNQFELVSDFGQYYDRYYEGDIYSFGLEFVIPFFFQISRFVGFGFYDFTFLYCLLYLIPIYLLSKKSVTETYSANSTSSPVSLSISHHYNIKLLMIIYS